MCYHPKVNLIIDDCFHNYGLPISKDFVCVLKLENKYEHMYFEK